MEQVPVDAQAADATDIKDVVDVKTFSHSDTRRNWLSRTWSSRGNQDVHQGWKPLSMSTPILLAIAALSLLIAAAIETLAQRSQAHGGLVLSPSLEEIPEYAIFFYLYVPNIVAVIFSLVWSWVDLDVKRMQPWFELSKPEGATAENSIFLDYPYDFVATVPIKAAKRRHWSVFLTGTAMMVVFWVITPLQSAILSTGTVAVTEELDLITRSQLIPVAEQGRLLDSNILSTGYAIGWLEQDYPPFASSDYVVLPYYLPEETVSGGTETNWTASTTILSTELKCWPAEISMHGPAGLSSYDFLNGQGCNATIDIPWTDDFTMYYIGYYGGPYSMHAVKNPACPPENDAEHQFLAILSETLVEGNIDTLAEFDVRGMFCQPEYFKQEAMISVKKGSMQPDGESISVVSPRQPLLDTEFNRTAFEFLITNGIAAAEMSRDVSASSVIEQHPRLQDIGLTLPVSNMVGFALAGQSHTIRDYVNMTLLESIYNDAHRSLFSVAVTQLLMNETTAGLTKGTSTYHLTGVVVSRVFSAIVEGFLVLVGLSAIAVCILSQTATSNLTNNPSSIGRLVDTLKISPEVGKIFHYAGAVNDKELLGRFRETRLNLAQDGTLRASKVCKGEVVEDEFPITLKTRGSGNESHYEPIRPMVLRRSSGVGFTLILVASIIILSYLKDLEISNQGLVRPSTNFLVLQILENYVPTIFATLVEPFWVLLNRLLCVLQPFKELWEGNRLASQSLDLTYTAVPPQLALWKAIKSKRWTLSLVCSVTLLANVLAVGLGALFNENAVKLRLPLSLNPLIAPVFDGVSIAELPSYIDNRTFVTTQYQDHFYITAANLSSNIQLPAWVSSEFFFQPSNLTGHSNDSVNEYNIQARGFGVRPNCTSLPQMAVPVDAQDQGTQQDPNVCGDVIETAGARMRANKDSRPDGRAAYEYCQTVTTTTTARCDRILTLGWARTDRGLDINATVDASFAVCQPIFHTALFNLTIDPTGRVISYKNDTEFSSVLDYGDSNAHSETLFIEFNNIFGHRASKWHNDTVTRDWMSHLVTLKSGSRKALDAEEPVPDPAELIPHIEDVYRRLLAVFLSLNQHLFIPADSEASIEGTRLVSETRIFMDETAFIISVTILAINVIVAALYYIRSAVFVLPRMPSTIGSMIAYLAPSRIVASEWRQRGEVALSYSFGRYIGYDGQGHIGIEVDPHVVPIEPSSLHQGRGLGAFRKRMKRDGKPSAGPWL